MSGNSILDELAYDQSTGSLTYKGVRYLLIRPETIIGVQKEIEELRGEKASEYFYRGGFRGGYLSAKKYREIFHFSDRKIIEFMMKMGTEIGWGCFNLNHYDAERGIIRVDVMDSPFAASYGKSFEGVCHLIRGVIGGMASVLFGEDCTASEIECVSKGDDRCLFVADSSSRSPEILKVKK